MQSRVVAIRHAKPVDPDPRRYPTDYERPITAEGEQQLRHVCQLLRDADIIPDYTYTSPALRAVQCGDIIAKELGGHLSTEEGLGSVFDDQRMLDHLHPGETTFLVGHNPTLAQFVERLVGEAILPAGLVKSGAIVVEFEGKPGFGLGRVTAYYRPA